jgi:hypothetical protein
VYLAQLQQDVVLIPLQDDVWRRNNNVIKQMKLHAPDFDPHYPTSIAYRPLPRAALEAFLAQRGLFRKPQPRRAFFHSGLLNTVYLRMFEIAFAGSRRARVLHLGTGDGTELDMAGVDAATLGKPSTLGTGGGTDHDDSEVRARPAYRWERILDDPLRAHGSRRAPWTAKLASWFGLSLHWETGPGSSGLSVDVRLLDGRYVLLDDHEWAGEKGGKT